MSLSEIKITNVLKTTVIMHTMTTTINKMMQDIGDLTCRLINDIQKAELELDGPMVFVYLGVEDHEKPFTLQIAQPVKDHTNYKGEFKADYLEGYTFYQATYVGALAQIGTEGWEKVMGQLMQQGKKPGPHCREVYTKWVGPESSENHF